MPRLRDVNLLKQNTHAFVCAVAENQKFLNNIHTHGITQTINCEISCAGGEVQSHNIEQARSTRIEWKHLKLNRLHSSKQFTTHDVHEAHIATHMRVIDFQFNRLNSNEMPTDIRSTIGDRFTIEQWTSIPMASLSKINSKESLSNRSKLHVLFKFTERWHFEVIAPSPSCFSLRLFDWKTEFFRKKIEIMRVTTAYASQHWGWDDIFEKFPPENSTPCHADLFNYLLVSQVIGLSDDDHCGAIWKIDEYVCRVPTTNNMLSLFALFRTGYDIDDERFRMETQNRPASNAEEKNVLLFNYNLEMVGDKLMEQIKTNFHVCLFSLHLPHSHPLLGSSIRFCVSRILVTHTHRHNHLSSQYNTFNRTAHAQQRWLATKIVVISADARVVNRQKWKKWKIKCENFQRVISIVNAFNVSEIDSFETRTRFPFTTSRSALLSAGARNSREIKKDFHP